MLLALISGVSVVAGTQSVDSDFEYEPVPTIVIPDLPFHHDDDHVPPSFDEDHVPRENLRFLGRRRGFPTSAAAGSSDDHVWVEPPTQPRRTFRFEVNVDEAQESTNDDLGLQHLDADELRDMDTVRQATLGMFRLSRRLAARSQEVGALKGRIWELEEELRAARGQPAGEDDGNPVGREESDAELIAKGNRVATNALFARMTAQDLMRLSAEASEAAQRKLADARTCRVCLDKAADAVIHGCGHKVCRDCANILIGDDQPCPTCRGPLHEYTILHD